MATCPRCHAPLKPNAFTCGVCGLPVGARPGGAEARPSGRTLRARWIIMVGAALAVVAAVLIWSLLLRGSSGGGDEFLGTWRSQSMQSIGSATITRAGDAYDVLLTSGQTGQQARVQAHLVGHRLVVTPDDFSASSDPDAKKLGLLLKLTAGDFRIELSSVDPSRVVLHLSGASPAGQSVNERIVLEKSTPSPEATS